MMRPPRFPAIGAIRRRSRPGPSSGAGPANRSASRGAWLMLGGAFAAFTVSAGIMHSYAVFLLAFIEEFRWSRAETSIAYSVSQLVAGGSSPLVGALVDRLRARPPAGPRRWLAVCRPRRQRADLRALARGPAVRDRDDDRGQLPGAGGFRAVAVAPVCAAPRDGDLYRPVGQRLRASGLGAARSIPDIDDRMARNFLGAGGLHRRGRPAARGIVSPCRPLPEREPTRCDDPGLGRGASAGRQLDPERRDPHAAFLVVVRGIFVHRSRQLSGLAAPARLCRRCRV